MQMPKQLVLRSNALIIVSHLFLLSLYAQSGNVSGIVKDSSGRGVLVGAEVHIKGQTLTTATDDSGRYLLLGVPVGPVKVTVSYLGLATSTLDTAVSTGNTSTLDFSLAPVGQTEEVTVTENPELVGQARALNDQMNSINLVNL